MKLYSSFDGALYGISPKIRRVLEFLPEEIKQRTEEIRLRAYKPVCLTVCGETLFVLKNGQTCDFICSNMLICDADDLNESFLLLCRNSVYAHSSEIKDGYITMSNGHRAGICGTLSEQGILRDVSSINIRLSHEIIGCADDLAKEFDGGGFLIAGPPGSGKTTMLRDMIRQLSSGRKGKYLRIAVIDSRGEISGSSFSRSFNDLGENTDIMMIHDKAAGTEIAVRTLFPDIVAFDEIGTASELQKVSESFNAGVAIITTAHAGSIEDLKRRSITNALINSGILSKIALLSPIIGQPPEIFDSKDLISNVDI